MSNTQLRPWQLLPVPYPAEFDPSDDDPDYFYKNVVKQLIPDIIKMTLEGIPIDQEAVEKLRLTIDNVLTSVTERLNKNPLIEQYKEHVYPALVKEYKDKVLVSVRTYHYYLKEFNTKNITHRTYVVNAFLINQKLNDKCKEKWTIPELKKTNQFLKSRFLTNAIDGTLSPVNLTVETGMINLAKEQARLWNKPRYKKSDIPVIVPDINPASAKQLQTFFNMLEIEPITLSSKTGDASWNRKNIEMLFNTETDEDLLDVLQAFIDHSFSGIIKNNFLAAFDSFTIDGVLYGNIKLFGAKSFRPTSNSPNLLNMPSSKSIYAKPLKECFISPEGKVIYAVDLGALEDRGIANLSGDKNKQNIFLENLDGHSLNACGYFKKEIEKYMGVNTDNVAYVKEFFRLTDEEKHPELIKIRFNSKAPTFKLAYGGFPDDTKGGVITEEIFNNYHTVLYPGITDYRENYVLPFAQENGYIHLGLGCRIYTDDAEGKIRSINNATVQFWSILTLIAVNEINFRISELGYENNIKAISTIYDSIYFIVDADTEMIKWLNDNIIPILCTKWLEEEVVCNVAEGEIGLNWANLHKVKNNAPLEDIYKILEKIHDKK